MPYVWVQVLPGAPVDDGAANLLGAAVTAHDAALNSAGVVPWTPTLTNITVGSGSTFAIWARIAGLIWYRWKFIMGAGSAMGTAPSITLPVAPNPSYYAVDDQIGTAFSLDSGVASYPGVGIFVSGSTIKLRAVNAAGTYGTSADITAAIPFAWGSADALVAEGWYAP